MSHAQITLAEDAIHRPDEPRHFMALTPVPHRVRIRLGAHLLAETSDAIRLKEVGHRLYEPVLYVPETDVCASHRVSDRASFCPLKGDCTWFSFDLDDGEDLAWSYRVPFDFAEGISGRVAFDASRVTVEESPR